MRRDENAPTGERTRQSSPTSPMFWPWAQTSSSSRPSTSTPVATRPCLDSGATSHAPRTDGSPTRARLDSVPISSRPPSVGRSNPYRCLVHGTFLTVNVSPEMFLLSGLLRHARTVRGVFFRALPAGADCHAEGRETRNHACAVCSAGLFLAAPQGGPPIGRYQEGRYHRTPVTQGDELSMSWDEQWRTKALCNQGQPKDSMYVRGAAQNQAKQACRGCPVRTECLAEALDNQIEWGVWGGMTERERRAVLAQRPNVTSWRLLLETARTNHVRLARGAEVSLTSGASAAA
jgi:WhiB family redox-sensing transcriptional regulator